MARKMAGVKLGIGYGKFSEARQGWSVLKVCDSKTFRVKRKPKPNAAKRSTRPHNRLDELWKSLSTDTP